MGLAASAGVATVASPCVLPMLPLLLGATAGRRDWRRPLAVVAGFVLAFTAVAALFGASARAFGVSHEVVRDGAAFMLMLAGVLMLWPALAERLLSRLGFVADAAHRLGSQASNGVAGGLWLGATLGALWTPCAGPVLATILALVAQAPGNAQALSLLLAYALGAGVPMLAIAYGGQALSTHWRPLVRHATRLRQAFGVLVVAVAAAMLAQVDVQATAWLARWADGVAVVETASAQTTPASAGEAAPEFAGIDAWLNGAPLTMQQLRGRVVLVDFWTYDCVNCVRTLPAVQRWHERFASQGLVVVGVHTPEYGFEHSLDNLRTAVRRHALTYAIAQDNGYATWNAWRNRYWPAQYLVDRDGRIVFRHFGEGDEAAIEQRIEQLLKDAGGARSTAPPRSSSGLPATDR
jgi:cytochrome c biogenesis protein CcdA/thiol-disulfide isomerase/thioredoxin